MKAIYSLLVMGLMLSGFNALADSVDRLANPTLMARNDSPAALFKPHANYIKHPSH